MLCGSQVLAAPQRCRHTLRDLRNLRPCDPKEELPVASGRLGQVSPSRKGRPAIDDHRLHMGGSVLFACPIGATKATGVLFYTLLGMSVRAPKPTRMAPRQPETGSQVIGADPNLPLQPTQAGLAIRPTWCQAAVRKAALHRRATPEMVPQMSQAGSKKPPGSHGKPTPSPHLGAILSPSGLQNRSIATATRLHLSLSCAILAWPWLRLGRILDPLGFTVVSYWPPWRSVLAPMCPHLGSMFSSTRRPYK